MSIISDTYQLAFADTGLLRIDYHSVRDTAAGSFVKDATVWLDRRNIPWLIDAMRRCLETYDQPELSFDAHDDHLKVVESGPEQEPYIDLANKRDACATHAGLGWFAMSRRLAQELVAELQVAVLRVGKPPVDTIPGPKG